MNYLNYIVIICLIFIGLLAMVQEYTEKPTYNVNPPRGDVKSTITINWGFDAIEFSSTARTFTSSTLTPSQTAFDGQPDRIDYVYPVDLQSTLTLTDTATVTITKDGLITFSAAPDSDELVNFYVKFKIVTLDSLRAVQITAPGIDPSNKYRVVVYNDTTLAATFDLSVTSPVILQRSLFDSFDNLTIYVYLTGYDSFADNWIGDGSTTVWTFYKGRAETEHQPIIFSLDYKNKFENVWNALIAGGLATATGSAVNQVTALISQDKRLTNMITSFGVSVGEAVAVYAMIYKFVVDEGVREWSDFSLDGMLKSLSTVQAIAGLGLAGGQALLMSQGVMSSKASQVAALATGFGRNAILASAFLAYLGTAERWHYPV